MAIEISPDDEVRTIEFWVVVEKKWHHVVVRYHIVNGQYDEDVLEKLSRTATPSVIVDGVRTEFGQFAVYHKYLSASTVYSHFKAMKGKDE